MTTSRIRYTFYIDATLREGLQRLKAEAGISESEAIRRALAEWLEKRGVLKESDRKRVAARKRS